MDISQEELDKIAARIHSDSSPVGIDAKKTHVLIIHMLEKLHEKIESMETRLGSIEERIGVRQKAE